MSYFLPHYIHICGGGDPVVRMNLISMISCFFPAMKYTLLDRDVVRYAFRERCIYIWDEIIMRT